MLHLFSGDSTNSTSLGAELLLLGIACANVDCKIVDVPFMDLLDGRVFEHWKARSSEFGALWAGVPCGSFSPVSNHQPGPMVLRSKLYVLGLPGLPKQMADKVREANVLVHRGLELAFLFYQRSAPFGLENPAPRMYNGARTDDPSFFELPKAEELARLPGVEHVDFEQCMLGSSRAKPTRCLVYGLALRHLHQKWCEHPKAW